MSKNMGKNKKWYVLAFAVVAIVVLAVAFCLLQTAKKPIHKSWEYKEITRNCINGRTPRGGIHTFESDLNELGRKGWELVGIYSETGTNLSEDYWSDTMYPEVRTKYIKCILKREIIK